MYSKAYISDTLRGFQLNRLKKNLIRRRALMYGLKVVAVRKRKDDGPRHAMKELTRPTHSPSQRSGYLPTAS